MLFARQSILLILLLISSLAHGQVDTLSQQLKKFPANHQKIRYLCDIANSVVSDQPLKAEVYLHRAESLLNKTDSCYFKPLIHFGIVKAYRFQGKLPEALEETDRALGWLKTCGNQRIEAELLLAKGGICFRLGKYDNAIEALEKAEKILIKQGSDKELASAYNLLGGVQWARGNYPGAIKIFLKALRMKERVADSVGIANVSNNIGIIYDDQKDYKNALVWYSRALNIYRIKNNNTGLRNALNNIGVAYKNLKKYDRAIVTLEESMALEKKAGNISGIGFSANNLGEVFFQKGAYPKAVVYFKRAIVLLRESGEESSLPACYVNLGRVNVMMGKNAEAVIYLRDGLAKAEKHENLELQKEASLWLYRVEKKGKSLKSALTHFEIYHSLSDSLNGLQARKQMNELLVQYESDKKENLISSLEREKAFQTVLLDKKRTELLISVVSSLVLLILAIMLLYTYYQKRVAFKALALKNREIEEKNEEISVQHYEIFRTNLRLTDSITYAKTIQNALLAPIASIKEYYSDFFYLNRPKDIVSGDFVWVAFRQNKMMLVAVDCTGHGVPGAFMSVLAISHLNQFFIEATSLDPAWFASRMRDKIVANLHQHGKVNDSHDGLALAIAVIDRDTLQLDYAGAGMDSLIVRKERSSFVSHKIKGNRTSIGYIPSTSDYNTTTTTLLSGDRLFLYSDGFADQLGEKTGRKLLFTGFEKLLLNSSGLPLQDQYLLLEQEYDNWKGTKEQVDDMMVFGLLI
ncbi:tetratricopeptide repeat protein [Williamwhitmania taraxaci]|uniref:Serine phosphatase RsbU, regulator of sigma subunit n=1 Tax=Williamwhitmania taraxaci TaxID=1640674 RepID=A0A1G6H754_9BACT|nr:tetratricopeptide repeat protein [Williamwhitmania taraxaci]SDB89276.1 Serine phosphatase RsbU, regulator of sigma subunit [Williamwhitmania taraxaci]